MEKEIAPPPKLIHIAFKRGKGKKEWLFLRQLATDCFCWHLENSSLESPTEVVAKNCSEAIKAAWLQWKTEELEMLMCGFRYSLPERDEHGINALFHQMAASYSSPNGIYFDVEAGFNCIVHNASSQALLLWKKLLQEKRL